MARKLEGVFMRQVYYFVNQDATTGQKVYRRAPFNLAIINGGIHIHPWIGGMNDKALTQLALDAKEDRDMWRMDLGYDIDPIFISEHQMGDGTDNWMGLHSISNI